jgi:SecD/SecF fusion protein
LWVLLAGGLILLPAIPAISQDATDSEPAVTSETPGEDKAAADSTNAAEDENTATTSEVAPATSATPATESTAPSGDTPPAPDDSPTKSAAPFDMQGAAGGTADPASPGTEAEPSASIFDILIRAVLVLALFIVPITIGNFLAKLWKMPDHAWKFSLLLFTLAVSALILSFGEFKFGPDLRGGITLVYELADKTPIQPDGTLPSASDAQDKSASATPGRNFTMDDLVTALKERIDPTGIREVTIRAFGQAIEIIIPKQAKTN